MLYSETLGEGPDVIFLHGLFGSGDNWRSVARKLSQQYRLHLLDLPNHGRSDWMDSPNLDVLAEKVDEWAQQKGLTHVRLLGHSMGGKVAMQMALNPTRTVIDQLIIVDIAPRVYEPHHQDIFKALKRVDFTKMKDRKSVDADMKDLVTDDGVRQFLLKSLYKKDDRLAWRFNVEILEKRYDAVGSAPRLTAPYIGRTLFIKGMNSQYIRSDDQESIRALFPNTAAKLIEGAGHWPHAEKPTVFVKILNDFLNDFKNTGAL